MHENINRILLKEYLKSELRKVRVNNKKVNYKQLDALLGVKWTSNQWFIKSKTAIPSKKHYIRLQVCLNALLADLVTFEEACQTSTNELHTMLLNAGIPLIVMPMVYEEMLTHFKAWSVGSRKRMILFLEAYMLYEKSEDTLDGIVNYMQNNTMYGKLMPTPSRIRGLMLSSGKFECDLSCKPSMWRLKSSVDTLHIPQPLVGIY